MQESVLLIVDGDVFALDYVHRAPAKMQIMVHSTCLP